MAKRRSNALLVGCNYPGTPDELEGCHQDVLVMEQTLTKTFKFERIEVLTDKPGSKIMPTGANIKQALKQLIDHAEGGDVLYFHFSGHGVMVRKPPKEEEAIVPCDLNLITSVDFRHFVDKLPKGAIFTIIADSCNSGGLIDKEPEQVGPHHPPSTRSIVSLTPNKPRMIPYESVLRQLSSVTNIDSPHVGDHLLQMFGSDASLMFQAHPRNYPRSLEPDEGILLSGCQSDEKSQDVRAENGGPYGAFSNAVQLVLKENHGSLSNKQVVIKARKVLERQGFTEQHPCLYCSEANADAIFLCHGK